MKRLNQPVGCGLWLVWLLAALFAAEWLLLWLVIRLVPLERLPVAVLTVAIVTIIGGSATLYFRVRWKVR